MTRTLQLGNKLENTLILTVIIFLVSCKSLHYSKNNMRGQITEGYNNSYVNEALKFRTKHKDFAKIISKNAVPAFILKEVSKSSSKSERLLDVVYEERYPNKIYTFYLINSKKKSLTNYTKSESPNAYSIYINEKIVNKDSIKLIKGAIQSLDNKQISIIGVCYIPIAAKGGYSGEVYKSFFKQGLTEGLSALSQPGKENATSKDKSFFDLFKQYVTMDSIKDYYVRPVFLMEKYKKPLIEKDPYVYYELLMTAFSFVDNVDSIKFYLAAQDSLRSGKRGNKTLSAKTIDALKNKAIPFESIIDTIASKNVVMINEAHFDWRHRYSLTLLLDTLYKRGFSKIAFEGLSQTDTLINSRKYPIIESGYYTREPYFADMIRKALKTGYKVYGYEDTTNSNNRESMQARNLSRVYKKGYEENEKMIVFAGYGHIYNNSNLTLRPNMYKEFKMLHPELKILTIDQATYSDLFYKNLACSFVNDNKLSKNNLLFFNPTGNTDVALVSCFSSFIYKNSTNSEYVKLPDIIRYSTLMDQYIYCYYSQEYNEMGSHAIPLFISKVSANQSANTYYLPRNKYFFVVKERSGIVLDSVSYKF